MNDIERQLRQDAVSIRHTVRSTGEAEDLAARIDMTPQVADGPQAATPWPWFGAAALATVCLAVIMMWRSPQSNEVGGGETTPIAGNVPTDPATIGLPSIARVPLESVSATTPLEQEWLALQADVERAGAHIREDLPVRF